MVYYRSSKGIDTCCACWIAQLPKVNTFSLSTYLYCYIGGDVTTKLSNCLRSYSSESKGVVAENTAPLY